MILENAEFSAFLSWVETGVTAGWISDVACATHAGIPTTQEEDEEMDAGYDPCLFVFRTWVD